MFLITMLLWGTLNHPALADSNDAEKTRGQVESKESPFSETEMTEADKIINAVDSKPSGKALVPVTPKTPVEVRRQEGRDIRSLLDGVGTYLTMSDIQLRVPRDADYEKAKDTVVRAFSRKGSSGIVLTSASGAGKSTMLENIGLDLMMKGDHVVALSANSLVAGTKYRGEAEERFQKIITVSELYPNIVWLVDDLHLAKGAGTVSGSSSDFLDAITPYIAKGIIKIIGATSSDYFHNTFSTDPGLKRVFQEYKIVEPKGELLFTRLRGWADSMYSAAVAESLTTDFLIDLERLSNYFAAEGVQPSKAVRYLSEILATKPMGPYNITDIYAAVEAVDGIPAESFTPEAKAKKLEGLKLALDKEVIGQNDAKEKLIDAAYLALSQMKDKASPQLKLLFYGMKGQGKTTIAEVYANYMGLESHRFMMSSYRAHDIEKLKYEIALEIQKNPFTVLFFDEIEKTPLEVQKALLDFMDKGYFTVNYNVNEGRIVSIGVDTTKSSVIFATNAGEQSMIESLQGKKASIGFIDASSKESKRPQTVQERRAFVMQDGTLAEHLIDRLQPVGVYSLSKNELIDLVKIKLQNVFTEIKADRNVEIYLAEETRDAIIQKIVEATYSPTMSNRSVNDMLEELIRVPFAKYFVKSGNGDAFLQWSNGELEVATSAASCSVF